MDWQPRPGQLVVCIDDSTTNDAGLIEIVRGHLYTVRDVVDPDELWTFILGGDPTEPGITLMEIRRERDPEYGEVPFRLSRFRPVESDRIEVFRRLLAPVDRVPA